VPVAVILAAAVILGGVVVVAMGRGGELARERPDAPASADFRTWSDVAHYRPPGALLGYHARTTEHALSLIARTIAERDAEIEWLRQRLTEARPGLAPYEADEAGSAGSGSARSGSAGSAGLVAGADDGVLGEHAGPAHEALDEHAGLARDAMRAEHSFGGRIGDDE
jgi:hypothetical protein